MALADRDREVVHAILGGKATGYRYGELSRLLLAAAFVPPKKSKGSHRVWRHGSGIIVMVKDDGARQLLPVYAKEAAKAIVEAGECPK